MPGEGRRSPGSGIPPPGSPESGIFAEGFSIWERDSLFGNSLSSGSGIPPWGKRGAGFSTGSPAGVTGERNFPLPGLGSRFFFPAVSESSLAFQTSCGSLGPFTEKDDEARGAGFPRQNHQKPGFSEAGFSIWERDSLLGYSPSPGSGNPSEKNGERDFRPGPPPGSLGSGIFLCREVFLSGGFRVFPSLSNGSPGPFTERIPPPGSPESGIFAEAGFSIWERDSLFGNSPSPKSGIPPPGSAGKRDFRPGLPPGRWGAEFSPFALRKFPSPGSGIPPPGSPESGIFAEAGFSVWERDLLFAKIPPRRGAGFPRRGQRGAGFSTGSPAGVSGAEFSPAGVAGSGVFPRQGQVQGVKGHSILHCTPWLAGILRSVDSICWQGADLEAVAFSCTGRRLARAANGLGFPKIWSIFLGISIIKIMGFWGSISAPYFGKVPCLHQSVARELGLPQLRKQGTDGSEVQFCASGLAKYLEPQNPKP